jgi:hypothetical protein
MTEYFDKQLFVMCAVQKILMLLIDKHVITEKEGANLTLESMNEAIEEIKD